MGLLTNPASGTPTQRKSGLEGWDMRESTIVAEGKAEGRAEGFTQGRASFKIAGSGVTLEISPPTLAGPAFGCVQVRPR
jgi:hypothetical protein